MSEPTSDKKRKRINQSLDEDLHRRLKARAATEGVRLHELIERLLSWAADKTPNGGNCHA